MIDKCYCTERRAVSLIQMVWIGKGDVTTKKNSAEGSTLPEDNEGWKMFDGSTEAGTKRREMNASFQPVYCQARMEWVHFKEHGEKSTEYRTVLRTIILHYTERSVSYSVFRG